MLSQLLSHVRHNAVAYLALFFALGGTALAAKPLITGAEIIDGTVMSADIADDTGTGALTGRDIVESTLGKVGDADTLDSLDATAFLRSASAAGGDLSGPLSNLQIEPGAVGPRELEGQVFPEIQTQSRTAADPLSFSFHLDWAVDGNDGIAEGKCAAFISGSVHTDSQGKGGIVPVLSRRSGSQYTQLDPLIVVGEPDERVTLPTRAYDFWCPADGNNYVIELFPSRRFELGGAEIHPDDSFHVTLLRLPVPF